jgi:hypothetical protein
LDEVVDDWKSRKCDFRFLDDVGMFMIMAETCSAFV